MEKRNAYVDMREEKETNEDWDAEKLQQVVSEKHGKEKTNQTAIVCRPLVDLGPWGTCSPIGRQEA